MKLELTESARKFIGTLSESDLTKVKFTEAGMESDDPAITAKFEEYVKDCFEALGNKVRLATEQFKAEHPEYFN
jgi:hypothetical protein